jgi:hypothetical protein
LETSTPQVEPGQNLSISIKTNPNSFVGLLGVDQSVLLLKKGWSYLKKKINVLRPELYRHLEKNEY